MRTRPLPDRALVCSELRRKHVTKTLLRQDAVELEGMDVLCGHLELVLMERLGIAARIARRDVGYRLLIFSDVREVIDHEAQQLRANSQALELQTYTSLAAALRGSSIVEWRGVGPLADTKSILERVVHYGGCVDRA